MEVTFYPRKDHITKKGYMPIRMHITVDSCLIKKLVKKVKVKEIHWKQDKQRIKPNSSKEEYNFHVEYNEILDELSAKVKNIERYAFLNNIELTKEYVLSKLDEKITVVTEYDFFETFDEFIKTSKGNSAQRTITGYRTVYNFLKDFEKETNIVLSLNDINLLVFDELRNYAFYVKEIKNNYFAKITNVLKRFMSWSLDREYHKNIVFRKFSAPEDEIEVIFLTVEELLRLYNKDFPSSKYEKVRDIYCFACFTGLRYSDLHNLKPSNIHKDHIKLNIKKTKDIDHIIPLNKYSQEILKKYKGTPFEPIPMISSQKFNTYIKKCCELAEIDTPVTISRYKGSTRYDVTLPKHKLITCHTARKTFATNSLILGMDERVVRTITGHKKESTFSKYVNIANDHKKKQMENTWDKL